MPYITNQSGIAINTQRHAGDGYCIPGLSAAAVEKVNGTLADIPAIIGIRHQVVVLLAMPEDQPFQPDLIHPVFFDQYPVPAFLKVGADTCTAAPV